jgi:hypothetical protein
MLYQAEEMSEAVWLEVARADFFHDLIQGLTPRVFFTSSSGLHVAKSKPGRLTKS